MPFNLIESPVKNDRPSDIRVIFEAYRYEALRNIFFSKYERKTKI